MSDFATRTRERLVEDQIGVTLPKKEKETTNFSIKRLQDPVKIKQMSDMVRQEYQNGATIEEIKQFLLDNGYDPTQFIKQ